jgi:uncharacterized membrane protein
MFPWLHHSCPVEKIEASLIVNAIKEAEINTSAEIRVHYTTKKSKSLLLNDAQQTFEALKMHETELRNGILIFLRLKTKEVAILGDIGIHKHVGNEFWEAVKEEIIATIKSSNITQGIIRGIELSGKQLSIHFPPNELNPNELSDEITHD